MELIPAVDVLAGKVVRLERGDFGAITVYGNDPVAHAERWLADGASLVHVVDLEGARSGMPDVGLWRSMGAAGVRFQVGGGVRTADLARTAVECGASRVVVGTSAVWEPDTLAQMVSAVGTEAIVAALDVRFGRAVGTAWTDDGRALSLVVEDAHAIGIYRVLVTGVSRDGTLEGPDTELLEQVAALAPGMKIMAAGGVASLAHLRSLARLGVESVIVGRALYDGQFTFAQAQAVMAG